MTPSRAAVKELNSIYYIGEILLIHICIYTHDGN